MDHISKLQRDRNRVLVFAAGAFLLWQGATLAIDLTDAANWSMPPFGLHDFGLHF